jgi:hypothetical protein
MQSATFYLKMMGETAEKPENPLACALDEMTVPDARLAEAVAAMFASVDELGHADFSAADSSASRRVGYLLERFGKASKPMLEELLSHVQSVNEPLFFTRQMTPSRSKRLLAKADDVQLKWGVYGELELRAT